jgi:hypothetical protein
MGDAFFRKPRSHLFSQLGDRVGYKAFLLWRYPSGFLNEISLDLQSALIIRFIFQLYSVAHFNLASLASNIGVWSIGH